MMTFQASGVVFFLIFPLVVSLEENFTDPFTTNFTDFLPEECGGRVVCPAVIKVTWNGLLARQPHVIKHDNGTHVSYDGLFPLILQQMLTMCCGLCTHMEYVNNNLGLETSESDLFLPVILNYKESGLSSQNKVVPILPYTGVAFVVIIEDKKNLPVKILSSIFNSWPVLVLTLVLSVTAGIVAWALDTRQNTQEFPMTFLQGSWEGFWWAFVSMTTVGYGDRCPRSISGRLFAVVWILVGICMCSIFTAMLTTSLTTISLDTVISLPGSKVAALMSSIEATTGFQHQADVIRVLSVEEIKEKMVKGEARGGLMDSFTLAHYRRLFPPNKFKVQEVFSQEYLEYGARVSNSSLASCMKNLRFSEESELYELAELYMGSSVKSGVGESVERSQSLFDPDGLLFYPALFMCLGIIAFLLLAGLTWEVCRRSFLCRRPNKERDENLGILAPVCDVERYQRRRETKVLLKEFEEKILEDVKDVVKALRKNVSALHQMHADVENDEHRREVQSSV